MAQAAQLVCLGAACIDRKYHLLGPLAFATSNPARALEAAGGVACNVAQNAARLGISTTLISSVGGDRAADQLRGALRDAGVDCTMLQTVNGARTAEYAAVLDTGGDLVAGVCDAEILETFDPAALQRIWPALEQAQWVFADCNLPAATLADLIFRSRTAPFKLAVDGVSEVKVRRLPPDLRGLDLLFLNESEAASLLETLERPPDVLHDTAALRARGAAAVVLTLGNCGLVAADRQATMIPAYDVACCDVTGAGDALIAGTLLGLFEGNALPDAARTGALLAAMTVESAATVLPGLSREALDLRGRQHVAH